MFAEGAVEGLARDACVLRELCHTAARPGDGTECFCDVAGIVALQRVCQQLSDRFVIVEIVSNVPRTVSMDIWLLTIRYAPCELSYLEFVSFGECQGIRKRLEYFPALRFF